MPFLSKAQMRTCYGLNTPKWDCNKWLQETPDICFTSKTRSRPIQKYEKIVGPVQTGPRGGKFFIITQKNSKGKEICKVKIYLSK